MFMATLIRSNVASKSKTLLYFVKNGDLYAAKLNRGGRPGNKSVKKKTAKAPAKKAAAKKVPAAKAPAKKAGVKKTTAAKPKVKKAAPKKAVAKSTKKQLTLFK